MRNVDPRDKPALYSKIFSVSSVKTLVHWFQIVRDASFHMYGKSGKKEGERRPRKKKGRRRRVSPSLPSRLWCTGSKSSEAYLFACMRLLKGGERMRGGKMDNVTFLVLPLLHEKTLVH